MNSSSLEGRYPSGNNTGDAEDLLASSFAFRDLLGARLLGVAFFAAAFLGAVFLAAPAALFAAFALAAGFSSVILSVIAQPIGVV